MPDLHEEEGESQELRDFQAFGRAVDAIVEGFKGRTDGLKNVSHDPAEWEKFWGDVRPQLPANLEVPLTSESLRRALSK